MLFFNVSLTQRKKSAAVRISSRSRYIQVVFPVSMLAIMGKPRILRWRIAPGPGLQKQYASTALTRTVIMASAPPARQSKPRRHVLKTRELPADLFVSVYSF
jgi:hypothetical protein